MLLSNFIDLFLESAFWLLLGLFLAGMLKMFVPMSWMNKQLGGHGFKSIVKAAILGAPLPLCSCGVIPAAVGLRRAGASKAATTSFLISTPETGVDSVTISYVLLGPFMAIVRPIAAIISAIAAGLLVGKDEDYEERQALAVALSKNNNQAAEKSCCSGTSTKSTADPKTVKDKPAKFVFANNSASSKKGFSRDKLQSTTFTLNTKQPNAKSDCLW